MDIWEGVALSIIIAVMGWLFIRQEKQGNAMTSIEIKLNYIIESQKALDQKLNLFLADEMNALKAIIRQERGRAQSNG